ncbi:MAG: cellulase family glycosylhydrolase [Pirellulales bacterium]
MLRLLLPLFLAALAVCCAQFAPAADELTNFITRRGDQLFDGDRPYRFISFNIPNLMVIEDAYEFTKPNPWRWPDEFEIEDALESVRQMGGQVVRTYVLSVFREGSDMGECVHVRRPGEFNEEAFRALDKVIEVARRKNIRVIIPFVDQAKWWGGIGEYAAFRGKPADSFWTDPQIIDDFKATVRYLLTRKNRYTGVAYRDEPAIFGWETGNEILPTPEWTAQIGAYLKQLDSNHLVLDGKSLRGVPVKSLDDPNVDVITTHHYPFGEDHDFAGPIRAAHALTNGKKAYLVGEFGFVETPHITSAIQTVIDDGISGALLWSLRMHRREGGFYWHMEVGTGRNIYKAFHWPGFASGDRYDEDTVMPLIRNKAYEIRGLQPPPLERPAPPKLLSIDRASAISWQGAAGAAGYDVWRATAAKGPWIKIAANVSDADVQYRPLFHDNGAVPGQQYWYRVVARNMAGESEPSNITGPVVVDCRTLVDECRDLSLTAATEGDVSPVSENARTVQEDCHRLALRPGSAVTYHVEKPISRWSIYAFAPGETTLAIETSTDGKSFQPAKAERKAFPSSQSVYSYSTPILFRGKGGGGNATYLRMALRETPVEEKSQNESRSTKKPEPATAEISRVEIEFDRLANRAPAPEPAAKKAAQLNSSIFIDGRPLNNTLATIDAAAARGERRLNVVVTILVDLTEDLRIKSFGSFSGSRFAYEPYDDAMREELKAKLRQVFARMVTHNMAISILPHIDAGGRVRQWRNWVDFDPLESYSGYTYDDLMIGTIANALAETAREATEIEMALSGEMGTSLFLYPESYRTIVRRLRERPELKKLKIGISLNHGGIAGRGNPTGAKEIRLSDDMRQQMQSLIEDCDFIGMSFYAPVSVSPTPDDFVRGIERFMGEFQQYGLSVPTTKPMQFSEVGIGGRRARSVAVEPAKAAETPWEGTANPRDNPWAPPPMHELRREYHDALLRFLAEQPARWPVSAAFLWSMGSWDPLGHGRSEFADAEIMAAIEKHNRAATSH